MKLIELQAEALEHRRQQLSAPLQSIRDHAATQARRVELLANLQTQAAKVANERKADA